MKTNPAPVGKLRGLAATASACGVFTILAFDHRQSFLKMLDPLAPESVPYTEVVAAKTAVIRALSGHASATLLDPLYGAAQAVTSRALPGQAGLILALEETGYRGSSSARLSTLLPDWSVRKARRCGTDAVKLLLYYHPGAGELAERQEELARRVIEECRSADLPLFLEAISYSIDPRIVKDHHEFAAQRPGLIAETARRLGALGPEVLKLEFPVDVRYEIDEVRWTKACEAVSAASPCPWAVLSAGVDFELFIRQVRAACRSGATGYIAGRAVWQEGIPLPPKERDRCFSKSPYPGWIAWPTSPAATPVHGRNSTRPNGSRSRRIGSVPMRPGSKP